MKLGFTLYPQYLKDEELDFTGNYMVLAITAEGTRNFTINMEEGKWKALDADYPVSDKLIKEINAVLAKRNVLQDAILS